MQMQGCESAVTMSINVLHTAAPPMCSTTARNRNHTIANEFAMTVLDYLQPAYLGCSRENLKGIIFHIL